jgi:short-subunit dehydrogenase
MASGLAYRGLAGWSVYAATKFGLRGLTECVRAEVAGEGIKVGLVAPGFVETGFHEGLAESRSGDSGGGLSPEDVAHAVISMIRQPAGSDIKEIVLRYPQSPN